MRGCVVCSSDHTVESFKAEEVDVIEAFLAYLPFCKQHEQAVEQILEEKENVQRS